MTATGNRFGESRWTAASDLWDWADVQDRFNRLADGSAMFAQGLASARPAAGIEGRFFHATDTGAMFYDDATSWSQLEPDLAPYVRVDRTQNPVPLRTVRSGKDANGIFTTVSYYRVGGNLALQSVLSGGASPSYTTRTVTEYGTDGTTVLRTTTLTLSYDTDGALTGEA